MKKKIYTILDNCYTLNNYIGKPVLKFSKKYKEHYHDMAQIASSYGLASLSAGQIGIDINMFIILQKGKLIANKWKGYNVDVKDYQVFCNPRIEKFSVDEVKQWQFCPSVPGVQCLINRSKVISASWTDEKDQTVERELTGFLAILFQHQINHTEGKLIVDRKISRGEIEPIERLKKIMDEKDLLQIHKLRELYKEILAKGQGVNSQLVKKYQKLMQEVKYSIIERAIETKDK